MEVVVKYSDDQVIDSKVFNGIDSEHLNIGLLKTTLSIHAGIPLQFISVLVEYPENGSKNYICSIMQRDMKASLDVQIKDGSGYSFFHYYDSDEYHTFSTYSIARQIREWCFICLEQKIITAGNIATFKKNLTNELLKRSIRKADNLTYYLISYEGFKNTYDKVSKNRVEIIDETNESITSFMTLYERAKRLQREIVYTETSYDTVVSYDNSVNRTHADIFDLLDLKDDLIIMVRYKSFVKINPLLTEFLRDTSITYSTHRKEINKLLINTENEGRYVEALVLNKRTKGSNISDYSQVHIFSSGDIHYINTYAKDSITIGENLVSNNNFLGNIPDTERKVDIKSTEFIDGIINRAIFSHYLLTTTAVAPFMYRREDPDPHTMSGYTMFAYPGSTSKTNLTFIIKSQNNENKTKITTLTSDSEETLKLFWLMMPFIIDYYKHLYNKISKEYLSYNIDIDDDDVSKDGKKASRRKKKTKPPSQLEKNIDNEVKVHNKRILFEQGYTNKGCDTKKQPAMYLSRKDAEAAIETLGLGDRQIIRYPYKGDKLVAKNGTEYKVVDKITAEMLDNNGKLLPNLFKRFYFICPYKTAKFPGIKNTHTTFGCVPCCFKTSSRAQKTLDRIEDGTCPPPTKNQSSSYVKGPEKYISIRERGQVPKDISILLNELNDENCIKDLERIGTGDPNIKDNNPNTLIDAVLVALGLEDTSSKQIRADLAKLEDRLLVCISQEFETNDIGKIRTVLQNESEYLSPSMFVRLLEEYFECNIIVFKRHSEYGNQIVTNSSKYGILSYMKKLQRPNILIYEFAPMGSSNTNLLNQCTVISFKGEGRTVSDDLMAKLYMNINGVITTTPYSTRNIDLSFYGLITAQLLDDTGRVRGIHIRLNGHKLYVITSALPPLYDVPLTNVILKNSLLSIHEFKKDVGMDHHDRLTDSVIFNKIVAVNYLLNDVKMTFPLATTYTIKDFGNQVQDFSLLIPDSKRKSQLELWRTAKVVDNAIYAVARKRLADHLRDIDTFDINNFMETNFVVDKSVDYKIDPREKEYEKLDIALSGGGKIGLKDQDAFDALSYMIDNQYKRNKTVLNDIADSKLVESEYRKLSDFNQNKGTVIIGNTIDLENLVNTTSTYYNKYQDLLKDDIEDVKRRRELELNKVPAKGRDRDIQKAEDRVKKVIELRKISKIDLALAVKSDSSLIARDRTIFNAILRCTVWYSLYINRLRNTDVIVIDPNEVDPRIINNGIVDILSNGAVLLGAGKYTFIKPTGQMTHSEIYIDGIGKWTKQGGVHSDVYTGTIIGEDTGKYYLDVISHLFVAHKNDYLHKQLNSGPWRHTKLADSDQLLTDKVLSSIQKISPDNSTTIFESNLRDAKEGVGLG